MVTEKKEDKKEDFELPESQKYKLTLGIDREVVRRAKMQDINISFWTEQLLKIMTFDKKEITTSHEDVLQTWFTFLSETKRILERYELEGVSIGEGIWHSKKQKMSGYKLYILLPTGYIGESLYDKNNELLDQFTSMDIETEELGVSDYRDLSPAPKLSKEFINEHLARGVLHTPMNIIEDLLYVMTQSSKVNKEKIKEMNIALRILKMMSENGDNNKVERKEVRNKT